MQQAAATPIPIGVYLNPVGQRRVDFQTACAPRFGRLFVADGTEQATLLLAQQEVDLLVIDLERFEYSFDLTALGQLIALRGGARTLLVCPFTHAGWLADLMAFGPCEYVISPLLDQDLCAQIAHGAPLPNEVPGQVGALLAASARLQQVIAEVDQFDQMADRICTALCELPGVVHASLFQLREMGDLELVAQFSPAGLNLTRLLRRPDRLLESPLRHTFPGMLAACSGEMALLDAPAKAGDPELAIGLADHGIEMVLGLPLTAARVGAPRGALCLMFERARRLASGEITALGALAQLAGIGLRMAEMNAENEMLVGRLTHMATTDGLTGVANRRHGETLLETEIRRARRYQLPLALIAFDIDRLKAVNDRYGHAVGDAAIRAVSATVQAALRNSDVLVRSAGAEFRIIAPHSSAVEALKIAEKIRAAIETTDIAGCDRLTISLGVGQVTADEASDAFALRVETALGRAKRAGRNCVELAMA